jgi:hypothetical protein
MNNQLSLVTSVPQGLPVIALTHGLPTDFELPDEIQTALEAATPDLGWVFDTADTGGDL